MAGTKTPVERPMSPHISVYRWSITMAMSIAHRVTGSALFFGTLLIVWWLVAASSGLNAYAKVQWFMGTLIGRLILLGYTWALIHHMLGGIRHLVWDTLHGMEPGEREWLAGATLIGSVTLTVLVWVIGYIARGGLP
jgi:succinate dehydrogenase / fumarate reductase cytochrome b subunit